MTQEVRHVLFNERELYEMVFGLLTARGDKRDVRQPRIDLGADEGGPSATLKYVDPDASDLATIPLSSRDMLAAAVLFLQTRHVPMPRRAEKHVSMVGGQLALVMTS
jgi:hypothetical protein